MAALHVNVAHARGLTVLAFAKSGKKFYTAGEDGLVRVWDASKDASQEPTAIDKTQDAITYLHCSAESWLMSGEDSMVRKFSATTDDLEGTVTQCGGVTVRCAVFSPDGSRIAVASEELQIKLFQTDDLLKVISLNGHAKGVRALSWDPSGSLLVSSGQEGALKMWSMESLEGAIEPVHTMDGILPVADSLSPEFKHNVEAVWHPNGRYFVVPTKNHEIVVIQNETWTQAGTFSKGGHNGAVTAICFSPNGEYLASAGADGCVMIWSTTTRAVLFQNKSATKEIICQIAFSPTDNLLAWTDTEGIISRWPSPIPSSHPHPAKAKSLTTLTSSKAHKELDGLFADEMDMDIADKDAEEGGGDGDGDGEAYDDGWIIDDDEEEPGSENPFRAGAGAKLPASLDHNGLGVREMVNVTKAQPAFQPGSTPFVNKKRYLAFNMIGVIECTDQETHNIINVEFHDKSLRRGYHFNDSFRYTLASLGPRGAFYACPPEKGTSNAAQIHYRPYDTWASSPEWSVELTKGETPVAICAGGADYNKKNRGAYDEDVGEDEDEEAAMRRGPKDAGGAGYAVVALSNGRVHIWLGTGIHMYTFAVGGEVVAMSASAEWLFIIYREGGTSLDGCQNLRYTLMTIDSYDIIKEGAPVPLAKGVTLKWMGFTSEEAPAIYDSQGVLHILDRFRRPTQGRWVPLLDTNTLARRVGKDESYWPVGSSLEEFNCIILKGREQHPSFPRPLIQDLEIHMPVYNMDNPKGQGEERILREKIAIQISRDAVPSSSNFPASIASAELELDKILITLIQTSCKADKLDRALDYTSRLHHIASYDLAMKVAEFYHLPGLRERMRKLKQAKQRAEGEEEDEDGRIIREGWGRVLEPVPRAGVAELEPVASSSRGRYADEGRYGGGASKYNSKNSLEFPPAPAVPRRSLANASAASSSLPPSSFPRSSIGPDMTTPPPDDDPFDSFATDSQTTNGKRKHTTTAEDEGNLLSSPRKRRASPNAPPRPLANTAVNSKAGNPFARKKDAPASNPFARKNVGQPINTLKSTSFIEKVDVAEAQVSQPLRGRAGKAAAAAKKAQPARQTTLFNLPAPPAGEKAPKGKKAATAASTKAAPASAKGKGKETTPAEDSQDREATRSLSPVADLAEEDSQETMEEETQSIGGDGEETERQTSPDWDIPAGDEDVDMGEPIEA